MGSLEKMTLPFAISWPHTKAVLREFTSWIPGTVCMLRVTQGSKGNVSPWQGLYIFISLTLMPPIEEVVKFF